MKPKKFDKKLFLNKKTIADLQDDAMQAVKGGSTACPTTYYLPCRYTCRCISAPMTNCTAC
jgi:natural product precursor